VRQPCELYHLSRNFGGIGYWARARQAYCFEAKGLIQAEAYSEAAQLLEQFEQAERLNGQAPHPDNRLLQAYALERLGQRARGLEVLEGVETSAETHSQTQAQARAEVQALRSALLVQSIDPQQAETLALGVVSGQYGEASSFARALALGTLGQAAYGAEHYVQAERFFEQSAILWALEGYPKREIGGLMNRATALQQLGRQAEVRLLYRDLLGQVGLETLRVRILLDLGYLAEQEEDWPSATEHYRDARELAETLNLEQLDAALLSNILHNLGHAEFQLGNTPGARTHLQQAMNLALSAGNRVRYAIALGNLGMVERSSTKLEMATGLLDELG